MQFLEPPSAIAQDYACFDRKQGQQPQRNAPPEDDLDEMPPVSSIVPPSDQDEELRASVRIFGKLVQEDESTREEMQMEMTQLPATLSGNEVVTPTSTSHKSILGSGLRTYCRGTAKVHGTIKTGDGCSGGREGA
jgi:hypothetical protein